MPEAARYSTLEPALIQSVPNSGRKSQSIGSHLDLLSLSLMQMFPSSRQAWQLEQLGLANGDSTSNSPHSSYKARGEPPQPAWHTIELLQMNIARASIKSGNILLRFYPETGNLIELRCKFGLPSTSTHELIAIPSTHLHLIEGGWC